MITEAIIALAILGIILYFADGILADIGVPEGAGCSLTAIFIFIIIVIIVSI